MSLTTDEKEAVCKDFNETIIAGLEGNILKAEDVASIADFFLTKLDGVNNKSEVSQLFSELALKWPLFGNTQKIAEGEIEQAKEKEVAQDVTTLLHAGKIDEALNLAKTETQSN